MVIYSKLCVHLGSMWPQAKDGWQWKNSSEADNYFLFYYQYIFILHYFPDKPPILKTKINYALDSII